MPNKCTFAECVRYGNLLELGRQRREKLEESCKAYQLVREAGELAQWIDDKERVALSEEVGDDLEQVEGIQRKFDDFQKVRKCDAHCFFFIPKNRTHIHWSSLSAFITLSDINIDWIKHSLTNNMKHVYDQ